MTSTKTRPIAPDHAPATAAPTSAVESDVSAGGPLAPPVEPGTEEPSPPGPTPPTAPLASAIESDTPDPPVPPVMTGASTARLVGPVGATLPDGVGGGLRA